LVVQVTIFQLKALLLGVPGLLFSVYPWLKVRQVLRGVTGV